MSEKYAAIARETAARPLYILAINQTETTLERIDTLPSGKDRHLVSLCIV